MVQQGSFNAVNYAYVDSNSQEIILRWEEMRDIFAIVIHCADPSLLSDAEIQYWQRVWPHHHVPKGAVIGSGRSGWMPDDDWFNGNWKTADINLKLESDRAIYTFNPINKKEFPDIRDFSANYRRTLKIRILFGSKKPEIKSIAAFTDSTWKEISAKVEWGDLFNEDQGEVSVYNGELLLIEPLTDNIKLIDLNKWTSDRKKGSAILKIKYAYNEDVNSHDKTIVTIRTKTKSFSFLIDDLVSGEKVFIKDYDVLVTDAKDNIEYYGFKQKWESDHPKTLYDRIKELPEQTYERAWNDMPKKKSRGFMPMGCEGGRQKFAVDQNGDVFFSKNYVTKIRGKDTDRVLWEGTWIRYSFGFPNTEPVERYRLDGYLPMIYGKWESDGIIYEQTAFVTLLGNDILSGERMQGDDPTVLLAKVTLKNTNDSQDITLPLRSKCDIEETLSAQEGFVFASNYEPKRLRYYFDTMGKGTLKNNSEGLLYTIHLDKDQSHSIYLKVPFITLVSDDEFETLKRTDYESEFPKVKKFWSQKVCEGTQIETPNQILNNFYKAHVTHMLITDDREVGSDRYASRVGTFVYGVFPDESVMCISDLDRRGYKKEAEERLELLIHYQSTVGVPGTYSTIEGQYYGAGGYECGGYNKSHGWVLWGLGEHYWYHRDKEWLNRIAPSIVKACDWINKERESTKRFTKDGKRVIEYGFLPAGSLEDVTDFWHWLATNAPTYWGFKNVAKALVDIGHPEGERLLKDAEEYGKDLMTGFRESMIISPVVKLRDGTFVPHFPPRLYLRGRGFGWLRETLEGAIHLIRSEMLDPCSDESTWIMKDYEDNLYISDRYGYSVDDFERDWFSLGGFSMQSNLLCHTIPYLWRDEPKHFLRGYFNAFASAFYPDICACVEHALPTLADNNGVWFKPSDEAQSTFWLRLMFIYERDNELNLGMCIPREWLGHGKSVEIKRAVTYFGEMDYKISSLSDDGLIKMTLNPPKRNIPKRINVRFRHPNEKPIKKVMVNGKEWNNFSAQKEMIFLGSITDTTEIIAMY